MSAITMTLLIATPTRHEREIVRKRVEPFTNCLLPIFPRGTHHDTIPPFGYEERTQALDRMFRIAS